MRFPLLHRLGLTTLLTVGVASAPAMALSLVTEDVSSLVSVNPGVYGIEIRGGRNGRADWELGVGTQTSNPGSFNQAELTWDTDPKTFELVWSHNLVSATIGNVSQSWSADWLIGNAIRVGISGRGGRNQDGFADFSIATLDGIDVSGDSAFSFRRDNQGYTNFFITDESLRDGWTMTGLINMTNAGGSRRLVHITTAEYSPVEVPVPATVGLLGLGLALLGFRRQRRA